MKNIRGSKSKMHIINSGLTRFGTVQIASHIPKNFSPIPTNFILNC